jgi:AP-3 complex subunit delta-1
MIFRELKPLFTCLNSEIRKKVCSLCVKLFKNAGDNEEIIEELTPLLADRLKDTDLGVKMAAISSIYEITRINPTVFVVTIPTVYQLLQETKNNWMMIKLLKLLQEMTTVEPRLIARLKPKLLQLL